MKKYVAAIIISTLTLGALSSAFASARVEGLHYWQTTTPLKQTVHLIEVDPAKLSIVLAHAKEKALGRETVSAIAKRYKAIAAINGGFLRVVNGSMGCQQVFLKYTGNGMA